MTQTVISNIHIGDFTKIKAISDRCFGKNYLTINTLNKIVNHEGIFVKIEIDNNLIGFCIAVTIDSLVDVRWFSTKEFKELTEFPYGIIKTIAIDPNFQNLRLGSKLLESAVIKLEAKYDLENILFPAWMVKSKTRLKGKLTQLGFRFSQEFDKYWFNESVQANYQCVNCGNPPCTCSLSLYKKRL